MDKFKLTENNSLNKNDNLNKGCTEIIKNKRKSFDVLNDNSKQDDHVKKNIVKSEQHGKETSKYYNRGKTVDEWIDEDLQNIPND